MQKPVQKPAQKSVTVTLSGDLLAWAEEQVANGSYASLEDVLGIALANMKDDADIFHHRLTHSPLREELQRRIDSPPEDFVPWDGEATRQRMRQRLAEREAAKGLAAE